MHVSSLDWSIGRDLRLTYYPQAKTPLIKLTQTIDVHGKREVKTMVIGDRYLSVLIDVLEVIREEHADVGRVIEHLGSVPTTEGRAKAETGG